NIVPCNVIAKCTKLQLQKLLQIQLLTEAELASVANAVRQAFSLRPRDVTIIVRDCYIVPAVSSASSFRFFNCVHQTSKQNHHVLASQFLIQQQVAIVATATAKQYAIFFEFCSSSFLLRSSCESHSRH